MSLDRGSKPRVRRPVLPRFLPRSRSLVRSDEPRSRHGTTRAQVARKVAHSTIAAGGWCSPRAPGAARRAGPAAPPGADAPGAVRGRGAAGAGRLGLGLPEPADGRGAPRRAEPRLNPRGSKGGRAPGKPPACSLDARRGRRHGPRGRTAIIPTKCSVLVHPAYIRTSEEKYFPRRTICETRTVGTSASRSIDSCNKKKMSTFDPRTTYAPH